MPPVRGDAAGTERRETKHRETKYRETNDLVALLDQLQAEGLAVERAELPVAPAEF